MPQGDPGDSAPKSTLIELLELAHPRSAAVGDTRDSELPNGPRTGLGSVCVTFDPTLTRVDLRNDDGSFASDIGQPPGGLNLSQGDCSGSHPKRSAIDL